MSPRDIRARRLSGQVAPWLWGFAYPMTGRGLAPLRRLAVSVWAWLFRRAWARAERAHGDSGK